MPILRNSAAIALGSALTATLFATSAAAQDTSAAAANECNPNVVPTQALAKATFSMQRAFQIVQANQALKSGAAASDSTAPKDSAAAAGPRDATRDLRDAIRALTSAPDKKEKDLNDSIGRAYYLGQAYILMLEQPNVAPVGKRGDYGIATDSSFTIDLLAAADSAFTKVEQKAPNCREEIAKWRQQQPWLDALNGAISAINEDEIDSAEVLAKRSLVIDRTAPYAYSILGAVSKKRKDYDNAILMYNKVIEIVDASKDEELQADRVNAMYDIADVATMRAEASSGPEKTEAVTVAIQAWNNFIPVGTRDAQIAQGVRTIRNLLKSIDEDKTGYNKAYAKILENPSHYGEGALQTAGLVATEAEKSNDAVTFFAEVVAQNPNQRDALNNLGASYVGTKEYEKVLPVAERFTTIDPNNPASWMLYAYAYTGLLKDTKDPKLVKMYTDSLVKYNSKADKLTTIISLTNYSHSARETSLVGTIENKSNASKTYTIEFEFLDAKGEVIASQSVKVGPVAAQASEPFTVTLEGKDAVAFRYKPL